MVIATLVSMKTSLISQDTQILFSIVGMLLIVIFQPHTHITFNCTDSVLFGGLAAYSILWRCGQSKHIAKVLVFFVPLLVLLVFVSWKLFQKLAIGGKLKICYYCCRHYFQVVRFKELQLSGRNIGASAQEQKPLLVKENSQNVPHTIVAVTDN